MAFVIFFYRVTNISSLMSAERTDYLIYGCFFASSLVPLFIRNSNYFHFGIMALILSFCFLLDNEKNHIKENSVVKYSTIPKIEDIENTKLIGIELYTKYFFLFQISGLILLVAMIGAITLTLRERNKSKKQKIYDQNNLDSSSAIIKKKIKLGDRMI